MLRIYLLNILFLLSGQLAINGHVSQSKLKKTRKKSARIRQEGILFLLGTTVDALNLSWMGPCEDVKAGIAAATLLLLGEHEGK